MNSRQQILQIIRNADGFVSGQQICRELGVSRTAVWKAIGKLREEGYPIEAVTRKGYRLLSMDTCDLLNEEELNRRRSTSWAGANLVVLDKVDSTNAEAFRLAEQGAPHGTLVIAGQQTAGKGRRGKVWESPPDVNLYMSLLLRPDFTPDRAPQVTLLAALAAQRAMETFCSGEGMKIGIKWPNDVVVCARGEQEYRKVCGILTEMRLEEREIRDVVIGMGINVNQAEFPEELTGTATSLLLAGGRRYGRTELALAVWQQFEPLYEDFVRTGDLSFVREAYEGALVNLGRTVRVLDPVSPYTGKAIGITDTGELRVRRFLEGTVSEVGTGEVSVRGVNGYV